MSEVRIKHHFGVLTLISVHKVGFRTQVVSLKELILVNIAKSSETIVLIQYVWSMLVLGLMFVHKAFINLCLAGILTSPYLVIV